MTALQRPSCHPDIRCLQDGGMPTCRKSPALRTWTRRQALLGEDRMQASHLCRLEVAAKGFWGKRCCCSADAEVSNASHPSVSDWCPLLQVCLLPQQFQQAHSPQLQVSPLLTCPPATLLVPASLASSGATARQAQAVLLRQVIKFR